jgi:proteasome lid subunit RPN8/RPN11
MIILTKELGNAIRADGERTYPNECCGFMFGRLDGEKRVVTEIKPAQNIAPDNEKYHRFGIDPAEFARGELFARKNKLEILGIYHSHPDHPAEPSDFDLSHSQPFYSYVITSVEKGTSAVMRSWLLNEDKAGYTEETIETI